MGRPCKLTPELQTRIVDLICRGNYIETAAKACGIDPKTFYNWMTAGQLAKSGKFADFAQAIGQAEAEAETLLVGMIEKAASDSPQAAQWLLERKYPARWGRRDRIDVHAIDEKIEQELARIAGQSVLQERQEDKIAEEGAAADGSPEPTSPAFSPAAFSSGRAQGRSKRRAFRPWPAACPSPL